MTERLAKGWRHEATTRHHLRWPDATRPDRGLCIPQHTRSHDTAVTYSPCSGSRCSDPRNRPTPSQQHRVSQPGKIPSNDVDTLDDSTITLDNDTPKTITVNGVDVGYSSGGYQVGSEQINPVDGTEGTGGIVLSPGSQAKVTMGADDIYLNGSWGSGCSIIDINWQNGDIPG